MSDVQRVHKSRDRSQAVRSGDAEPSAPARAPAAPAWLAAPTGAPLALGGVQRKVAIGASNDTYERQAEQAANRVASGGRIAPGSISNIAPGAIGQRQS